MANDAPDTESARGSSEDPGRAPCDPDAITIMVVEDNELLQEGIVSILSERGDLRVVAVASDANGALSRLPEAEPQLVLVDAGLGNGDSQELVERIAQLAPETRVVVMDVLPDPEDVIDFVRRGTAGFVVKQATVEVFIETLRSVAAGDEVLPPTLTTSLFSHIAEHAATLPAAGVKRAVRMTKRERQVIDLIAEGLSNKKIARRLHISTHTVKSHVRNILEKLALHSRLQVAAYWHKTHKTEGKTPETPETR